MRRIVGFLNHIEEWTLVSVILGLAFLSFAQVFCRYVLNFSFTWMEEVSRYVGVFVTFLAASLGVKYGSHFSMDLIYERVHNDRFRHGLRVLVHVLCAMIFVVVAYYGWIQAMKLRQFGALTSVLKFPKYWAYLPIPFFSLIAAVRFGNLAVKHLKGLIRNERFSLLRLEP